MTRKSNPSKRSPGEKHKSCRAQPGSPQSISPTVDLTPLTGTSQVWGLAPWNIHHMMENSQPELSILVSMSL